MRIVKLNKESKNNILEGMLKRSPNNYGSYESVVADILANIKENGDKALFEYTKKFDKFDLNKDNIRVTEEEIKDAYSKVSEDLLTVIKKSLVNVKSYHENEKTMTIKGRNTVDGLPKDVTISAEEVRNALASPLATIIDGVIDTLEKTPPELSADIIDRGITLTGGGALLKGLDLLISRQTGMPVHIADRPLDCVADGAGKRLETVMPKDFYRDRRR